MVQNSFVQLWAKVQYFFSYKMEFFFFFQNIPKNLDQSFKMDLVPWDCLGRIKTHIIAKHCVLI